MTVLHAAASRSCLGLAWNVIGAGGDIFLPAVTACQFLASSGLLLFVIENTRVVRKDFL
jgi:hypothetical protein